MAAIAGFLMLDGSPVPEDLLARLENAVRPFGSDRVGRIARGPFGAVCGMRIVAAEDRLGPVPARRGAAVMAADIRLDDRDGLAGLLGLNAAEAGRLSDTDLALRLCADRGVDGIAALTGDFALALFDEDAGSLILARDHVGTRPIYVFRDGATLAFASMPQILFALPFVPRELDPERLARYTAGDYADPRACLFRGIDRIPPATALTVTRAGTAETRYWEYDLDQESHFGDDQDYLDRFMELYRDAVQGRMRSEKPVGTFLSSGLDSGATTALAAAAASPERLHAYTSVPRPGYRARDSTSRYEDEGFLAGRIAALYPNVAWRRVEGGRVGFFEDMERQFFFSGRPVRNSLNRMWFDAILRAARDDGVGVMLDSGWGNQSVSWAGYDRISTLAGSGRLIAAAREAAALLRHDRRLRPETLATVLLLPLADRWRGSAIHRLAHRFRGDRAQRISAVRSEAVRPVTLTKSGAGRFWRRRRAERLGGWANAFAVDHFYGLEAAHGIALRDPTTDRRLVQYLLSIPPQQSLDHGCDRRLLRRAFAGLLPEEVLSNRRQGRQAADWAHDLHAARDEIAHVIDRLDRSVPGAETLDIPRLKALIASMPEDPDAIRERPLDFGVVLSRAAVTARFIHWFENRN